MKNIPNIRILRREVYVSPTFSRSGHQSIVDVLQYKDSEQWIDVPVQYETQYIDTKDNNKKVLGNY